MTSPYPLGRAALAVVAVFALTHVASAQTTNTWFTGAVTNQWTNDTNWSPTNFPNAVDSRAIFASTNTNATGNTIQATWAGTNITVGSIFNTPVTNGTAVVGDNSFTTDTLTLATTSGKPELFVSNSSSTTFVYATVQGTNGFTKTGPGQVTFRFNTNDHPYTGDVVLLGGTLGVNQASSLGNASNSLLVGSNATLLLTPGSNSGIVTFDATRSLVVSNGVTFNIQTSSNAISGVFSNPITGAGRVDFIGPTSGTNEASATQFTLAGSNNWTNRTTIQLGAKVALGAGSSISTGVLSLSGGSGSYAGLDLGGNTQSTASLEPSSSPNTPRVMVISNGTLNVGSGAAFTLNGTNGTLVDMSGLTAFSFAGAAGNRVITIQPNTTNSTGFSANNTNEVRLAATGAGSNNISAASIIVGAATGGSAGTNHQGRLILGQANTLSTTSISIGGFNGEGVIEFGTGITNGTTSLRGSNGVARLGNLTVGSTSSGTRSGAGTFDVGTVDASISNTFLGVIGANANNSASNRITMAGGTFDTLGLTIGSITNPAIISNSQTSTAIFQQNGGTAKAQTVIMGDTLTISNTNGVAPTYLSSYNLSSSNAVLQAQTIRAGTSTNYSTATRRKINFGAGRIETYDASTDLVIQGIDTTLQGRIEIAVASNAQTKTFFADTGRKITLEPSAILTFDGGITKDGAGTLVLKGTNVHKGNTAVTAGTLELQSTGALTFYPTGSATNNQLNGAGTANLDGKFAFDLSAASTNTNSTWTVVSNSLTTTYGTNFLVTGFSGAGGNWTNTTNGVNYVFAQSNGVLSVQSTGGVTPYNAWVAYWQGVDANFTNTAGTDNPDGDPFDNNEEFAFDGNPTIGTGALLVATKAGTNTVFNYVALTNTNTATYAVQFTTNLTTSWTNASVTISNSTNQTGISQTNIYARKEFVVPATNNEFYRVQATILP
jgi:autotransporter-associated beta strand protein